MFSRNNCSIEIIPNENLSSLNKLILLSKKNLKYLKRVQCCYSIPIILFELFIPLIFILIIIYFSHYYFNKNNLNEIFFEKNQYNKCSQYSLKEFEEKKHFLSFDHCLNNENDLFIEKYNEINLIIRYLKQSDHNKDFFQKFLHKFSQKVHSKNCLSKKKFHIKLWNDLSMKNQNDNNILFNETNGLNLIININELSIELFQYDLIVQIIPNDLFLQKILNKIDFSFLNRHQHPSEQFDLFQNKFPSYSNLKLFVDSIYISLILNDEDFDIPLIDFLVLPCPSYRSDKNIPTRWSFILMELILSITFLFYSFIIIYFLIKDKSMKIKQINQLIHIQPFIYYLSSALIHFFILQFITFTISGQYGIPSSWNFPFSIQYWIQHFNLNQMNLFQKKYSDETFRSSSSSSSSSKDKFHENNLIVEIDSLYKSFGETNQFVLNNIHFNLYENQITTLLGHNGAGKTTIMNILCGIYEQTYGSIKIFNYDTKYHMDYLRQFISYCPQHDILFDLLTVEEQIYFYIIAKGYSKDKETICSNFLEKVNLTNDRNTFCKNLSGGMKRRLSIACAFIGNTKLVLLDEPSSGLDPINRRNLWSWIQSMKANRTIFLTTHFLEEADVLSDRIIILSNGKLIANDTNNQLKLIYGTGYKLIVNTLNNSLNKNIFKIINEIFLNSNIQSEINNQLIIQTNETQSNLFIQLFSQLDLLKENNLILNYGLTNTTLDDVYFHLINKNEDKLEKDEENRDLIENNCLEIFNKNNVYENFQFYLSQYEGLLIKSFLIYSRSLIFFFFICFLTFFIKILIEEKTENIQIKYSFNDLLHLNKHYIFLSFINNKQENYEIIHKINKSIHKYSPHTHLIILNNITNIIQFNLFFLDGRKSVESRYLNEYLGIFIENADKICVLTSHLLIGYEWLPVIIEYFCKGLCRISSELIFLENNLNKKMQINFIEFIKNFSLFSCFYLIYPGEKSLFYLLTYYLIYIYIFILLNYENKQLIKLLKIFGLNPLIYWTSNYFFHLFLTSFYSFIIYFIFSFNQYHQTNSLSLSLTLKQILYENNIFIEKNFFLLTFIISLSTLPFIYLITKIIKNDLIGGLLIYLILILIEIFDLILCVILIMRKSQSWELEMLYWLMNIIFPSLNSKRLISIILNKSSNNLCKIILNDENILLKFGSIRRTNENDYLIYLLINLFQIIFFFFFLYLIDMNKFNKKIHLNVDEEDFNEDDIDEDVLEERNHIDIELNPFVCYDLIKKYSSQSNLILNHLTFHVEKGECFGLLGFNGAGKTSLFKIIVGEEKPTNGSIYLNGQNYENILNGVSRDIGYCPQYNCFISKLTLEEHFYLFARLRGIFSFKIQQIICSLSNIFLLDLYLNKYIHQLSGGTIRRYHTAAAFIASPTIILLDEPTTGVDPYSCHKMREIFLYALNNGITLILTSHSMEECELLCRRIGILSNGQFKSYGYIENLKNKFGNIYTIFIKFKFNFQIKSFYFYLKKYLNIKIYNKTDKTIIYQVENSSPAKLFQLIEQIKDEFSIETYSIQQMTLEQIFFSLQNSDQ
ncbi:unnamed protein product [Adineta steineri]|uniref:ABC transporter domain-containing protein n=1 Tax=Adineta steineri TaxID=433720 RepID=A0A818RJH6_9BILA|nr:unnamed protein product [Adineta steineri]